MGPLNEDMYGSSLRRRHASSILDADVVNAKVLAGFVDAIRARVSDKIREVKGRPGKQDRSDAVKQILADLIAEVAPSITDPNASYLTIMSTKDKQKQVRQVFVEVEEQATRDATLGVSALLEAFAERRTARQRYAAVATRK